MSTLFTIYYGGKRLNDIKADDAEHAAQVGKVVYKVPVVACAAGAPAVVLEAARKLSLFGALPLETA